MCWQVMDVTVHCLDQNAVKNKGLQEAFPPICRYTQYVFLFLLNIFYPAVRSIGWDTKFTVAFSFIHLFIMYRYGFLSPGFNDCREIVNGGSVISQTGLLLFWGISPGMAEFFGVNVGHMAGYASC